MQNSMSNTGNANFLGNMNMNQGNMNMGMNSNMNNINMGMNSNMNLGMNSNMNMNMGSSINMGMNNNMNMMNSNMNSGVNMSNNNMNLNMGVNNNMSMGNTNIDGRSLRSSTDMPPRSNQTELPQTDQQLASQRKFHKLTTGGGILKPPTGLTRPDLSRTRTLRSSNDANNQGTQPQLVQSTLTSFLPQNNHNNQGQSMQNTNSNINPMNNQTSSQPTFLPPPSQNKSIGFNNPLQSLPNAANPLQNSQTPQSLSIQLPPSNQNSGLQEIRNGNQIQMNIQKPQFQLNQNLNPNQPSMNNTGFNSNNNNNQFFPQNTQGFQNQNMNVCFRFSSYLLKNRISFLITQICNLALGLISIKMIHITNKEKLRKK